MNRIVLFLSCCALAVANRCVADEQTRDVQSELKSQGFFYGEADGKSSTALSAAIRRYQIRNGLEVSGQLNKETLDSLGVADGAAPPAVVPRATPRAEPPNAATKPHPPVHLRRTEPAEERPEEISREPIRPRPPSDPSIVRPPAPLEDERTALEPSREYSRIFNDTPYEAAPRVVQEQTLRRAQTVLKSRGFYQAQVDGLPGPSTEEAILSYQRSTRLPLTGNLDLETLNALRLLPGRANNPPLRPFNARPERNAAPSPRGSASMWVN